MSFEAVFLLFLFAGVYKVDPRLAWFPFDFTMFFFAVSLALGAVIICREGIFYAGLATVTIGCVFLGWVALTQLWTPGVAYAHDKLVKLTTLTLWSLIATAMIVAGRPERSRRFLLLLLVFGTIASLDAFWQYATSSHAFTSAFRLENYLGRGRLFGLAGLVALGLWIRTHPLSPRGLALFAALIVCSSGMLITGGRGPTLAMAAGMLLPLALSLRVTTEKVLVSRFGIAAVVLIAVLSVMAVEVVMTSAEKFRTVQRFTILFTTTDGGGSAANRVENWQLALRYWFEQPLFGHGNGSWPIIRFGVDVKRHPHNLVLEVLTEYGIVGMLLLVAVGFATCSRVTTSRLREEPMLMCAAMLAINALASTMTSSDLSENRHLFAMFGLLVMAPVKRRSHAGSKGGPRDLGASGRRHPDLHQGMPHAGGGRL